MTSLFTFLHILWRFSRPHTIIGSLVSVSSLYVLAVEGIEHAGNHRDVWLITLVSCLCCNVFITGLNQWSDVDIDRVNKPHLPIAAGVLKREHALIICLVMLGISVFLASLFGWFFLFLILLISLIGVAYSLPPLRFKKHHLGAATAIGLVRGLLVNIGIYLHYRAALDQPLSFPPYMQSLTIFITAFSIGIAWFKDIPDTQGDAAFDLHTLPLTLSRRRVFLLGLLLVSFSYGYLIFSAYQTNNVASMVVHAIFLGSFLLAASGTRVAASQSVTRFYMWFWVLFFAEYVAYPLLLFGW